jgi:hypothetical protein
MQTTKKKPSLIFILVGAVLAGYLGYLINGAWIEGIALPLMNLWTDSMRYVLFPLPTITIPIQ